MISFHFFLAAFLGLASSQLQTPRIVSVKLEGGKKDSEGYVLVQTDNSLSWINISSYSWDAREATVVCRQLGYNAVGNSQKKFGTTVPQSSHQWSRYLRCTGKERNLAQCSTSPLSSFLRNPNAAISCRKYKKVSLRFDSKTQTKTPFLVSGLLQAQINRKWTYICGRSGASETFQIARVVCRQLGYIDAERYTPKILYGKDKNISHILMGDIVCSGSEDRLDKCINVIGSPVCSLPTYIGVQCSTKPYPVPASTAIRLIGGASPNEGIVQIWHNNRWGAVCDDLWDIKDGLVACRQLGYRDVVRVTMRNSFQVRIPDVIWMDDVKCHGKERRLEGCSFPGWERENCGTSESAGVVCLNESQWAMNETGFFSGDGFLPLNDTEEDIRLVGGTVPSEGRVEIYYKGQWGTICDDGWDMNDAKVVCRQLGFVTARSLEPTRLYGRSTGAVVLTEVGCMGKEKNISSCSYDEVDLESPHCSHSEDATVRCEGGLAPEGAWSIRLVDSGNASMGRVEVFLEGEWGTVCNDLWNIEDANVVCRQLGYSDGAESIDLTGHFRAKTGRVWMRKVSCTGKESFLADCNFEIAAIRYGGDAGCRDHSEDAGVTCKTSRIEKTLVYPPIKEPNVTVRLRDGKGAHDGRVEVFRNGKWGTVCRDAWGDSDGKVVCRQLGYKYVKRSSSVLAGEGIIWLDDVLCRGNEKRLESCDFPGWGSHNCNHKKDVAITCGNESSVAPTKRTQTITPGQLNVRLSETNYVNISLDGKKWYSMCSSRITDRDATVICRQLGYAYASIEQPRLFSLSWLGILRGEFWRSVSFNCRGTERKLIECPGLRQSDWTKISLCFQATKVQCWGGVTRPPSDFPITNFSTPTPTSDLLTPTPTSDLLTPTIEYRIRLRGGPSSHAGRLEIFYKGKWGTVCNDTWTHKTLQHNIHVACRQLGYHPNKGDNLIAVSNKENGHIWMGGIQCMGSEKRLDLCSFDGWGVTNCTHAQDVAIKCKKSTPVQATSQSPTSSRISRQGESNAHTLAVVGISFSVVLSIVLIAILAVFLIVYWRKKSAKRSTPFSVAFSQSHDLNVQFEESKEFDDDCDDSNSRTAVIVKDRDE